MSDDLRLDDALRGGTLIEARQDTTQMVLMLQDRFTRQRYEVRIGKADGNVQVRR